ncbi:MAG: hypothetical protein K6357_06070 [Elusimicrobiota bacterium]
MANLLKEITFGTDGFRGVIGGEFNYENIRKIAQGFSDWLAYKKFKGPGFKVFVGYDRRFLSDKFAREFAIVLVNNDIDCTLSKTPVPTPMVSYLTTKDYTFGIMITASHNNYIYNGVKIKYKGQSIAPHMTAEIEVYVAKNFKSYVSRIPKKSILEIDLRKEYTDYIDKKFNLRSIFSKIKGKVVFDLMFGSSAEVFNMVFDGFKNIVTINSEHDPLFGEYGSPEPVEKRLMRLKEEVKKQKAICGFALDGDGDRFAVIDEYGNYLSPAQIAPMFLEYLINFKKMKGRVVQAVSLGFLTQRIARANNLLFEFVPVGFKYIASRISDGGVLFGAEESGGYSWHGNIPERDGIISSLMILEMVVNLKKSVREIYRDIEKKYGSSSFIREDFPISKITNSKYSFAMKIKSKLPKTIMGKAIGEIITFDGIRVILENDWWFLIRPSGTEPLLRIYVETDNLKNSNALMKFAKSLSVF